MREHLSEPHGQDVRTVERKAATAIRHVAEDTNEEPQLLLGQEVKEAIDAQSLGGLGFRPTWEPFRFGFEGANMACKSKGSSSSHSA